MKNIPKLSAFIASVLLITTQSYAAQTDQNERAIIQKLDQIQTTITLIKKKYADNPDPRSAYNEMLEAPKLNSELKDLLNQPFDHKKIQALIQGSNKQNLPIFKQFTKYLNNQITFEFGKNPFSDYLWDPDIYSRSPVVILGTLAAFIKALGDDPSALTKLMQGSSDQSTKDLIQNLDILQQKLNELKNANWDHLYKAWWAVDQARSNVLSSYKNTANDKKVQELIQSAKKANIPVFKVFIEYMKNSYAGNNPFTISGGLRWNSNSLLGASGNALYGALNTVADLIRAYGDDPSGFIKLNTVPK